MNATEVVTQREVTQKEKNKWHKISLVEFRKMIQMHLFAKLAKSFITAHASVYILTSSPSLSMHGWMHDQVPFAPKPHPSGTFPYTPVFSFLSVCVSATAVPSIWYPHCELITQQPSSGLFLCQLARGTPHGASRVSWRDTHAAVACGLKVRATWSGSLVVPSGPIYI